MTDDELERLVVLAIAPVQPDEPRADVWPALVTRLEAHRNWRWIDLGLAAAVIGALVLFPEWLMLLAYHF